MALLKCENLSVGYDGHTVASNLEISVESGDYLFVIGENGSGKSTLMKTLLGLIPPISGKVELENGLCKNEIGYLPQQTVVQKDFPASVFEVVLSGRLNKLKSRPFFRKADKKAAKEQIEKMGISALSHRCYRELSGGQQQRVLLARALCAASKLIILDEPVTGLDPTATRSMYELIEKLNKDGMTVIMISHDINAAVKYATKILHISSNLFFGSKEEYLQNEASNGFLKGGESK